jgi:hypothetical protein
MFNRKAMTLGTVCLLLAAASVAAEREWPDQGYDCQVVTNAGNVGLVSIQTYSRAQAADKVIGQSAATPIKTRETAVSAVQCIEQRSGKRFTDEQFQRFYEGLAG